MPVVTSSTHTICIILVSGILFALGPTRAPAQSEEVVLQGFVLSAKTGQPLPGANVILKGVDGRTSSHGGAANEEGYFRIGEIVAGRHAVSVSYVGYETLRDTLQIPPGTDHITETFELRPVDQTLDEVTVLGNQGGATTEEAGYQQVGPEDLARIPTPSLSGDLAGYLQSMPGVVSLGDRGGQLYIRGGTPDQNLVLMDKMQVFRPFHVVGYYSVFPQDLVANTEVYAGGFPAKYSGRLSSVIDVTMRGGNTERFEATGSVAPFLTGFRVEGPIANEGRTSILASLRFSQIERTAPTLLGEEQPLAFNDQFVKVQNTMETGRCSFTGLHTYDRGQIDPRRENVFRWTNYAAGGRCVGFDAGSSALADVSMNASYVQNSVGSQTNPEREAGLWTLVTRTNLVNSLGEKSELRGGFKVHYDQIGYALREKYQGLQEGDETLLALHGHVGATLPTGPNLDLRPGLVATVPLDYSPSLGPRVRARWRPFGSEGQELSVAGGYYRQVLVGLYDERDLGSTFISWLPAPITQESPAAWHAILGWRQQISNVSLTVEGYYKDLRNLAVPIWSTVARFTTEMTETNGASWGLDLRGEFERGWLYGYLGYGLSWTQYSTPQNRLNTGPDAGAETYAPPHDRRHEINAVLSADLGFATTNLRWQFGSGRPYTKPFGFDMYLRMRALRESPESIGRTRLLYTEPYNARLPIYHRLDASLERAFSTDVVDVTAKAGAINVYNRQNLFYLDLFTQQRVDQLPLVPYLAVEIATN